MALRIQSITKASKLLTAIPRRNHRVLFHTYGQRYFMNKQTLNIPMNAPFTYTLKASPLSTTYRSFHSSLYNQGVQPFLLADIGEGITECEVIQWFVEPGTTVAEFDKICEVQSDKASVEITSRFAGKVIKLYHNVHDIAKVGEPLVDIETTDENGQTISNQEITSTTTTTTTTTFSNNENNSNEAVSGSPSVTEIKSNTTGSPSSTGPVLATPPVRHLAKENNVDLSKVIGSGPEGRILKQDVLDYISGKQATPSPSTTAATSTINTTMAGPGERSEPLTAIQKAMFKSMTKSLAIPQLGFKDEIELNATTEYKNSLNAHISKHPEAYSFSKVSFLPIFIKCMSIALLQYPILNATIGHPSTTDNVNEIKLTYRSQHNIGIAMDTPQGLIVPNIKNVQTKTIFEVASELSRLIELGKRNAIPLEDLKGGTITLSNIGAISGTYASPVVVSSELAIVALGRMQTLPRFDDKGNVIAKQVMPVSWSADHRIIDGATIARFGNLWKTLIENPALLASELR